mgnify:CR=1 FL=1
MKLIFNHLTKTNHIEEVKSLLGYSKIKKVIISSAFATTSGVYQIENELVPLKPGAAFHLVEKLLHVNEKHDKCLIEVILLKVIYLT